MAYRAGTLATQKLKGEYYAWHTEINSSTWFGVIPIRL